MKIITLGLLLLSPLVFAQNNLSDTIDANEVPAELEEREKEEVNLPDTMDENNVPSAFEEREKEEDWRENYEEIQGDMKRQNKIQE